MALKIFLAADNEDRAGQATRKTAKMFLISSHFLEVAKGGFGEAIDSEGWTADLEGKLKYSRWKASEIVKALNEGRQPHPGPLTDNANTLQPISTFATPINPQDLAPPIPLPQFPVNSSLVAHDSLNRSGPTSLDIPQPPAHPPIPFSNAPAFPNMEHIKTRAKALSEAEKHARHAASAILFEDVSTAIQNLQSSLNLLNSLK